MVRSRTVHTAALAMVLACSPLAGAHTELDAPNGGEVGAAGSIMTVEWHVAIPHALESWELWYSTETESGPWTLIEADIPAGSPEADVPHLYDWTLPDIADESVWVRVVMVNDGTDYDDVSDAPFSIVQENAADVNGDGVVDASDLTLVILNWGACMKACEADVNDDGEVDVADLVAVILAWA